MNDIIIVKLKLEVSFHSDSFHSGARNSVRVPVIQCELIFSSVILLFCYSVILCEKCQQNEKMAPIVGSLIICRASHVIKNSNELNSAKIGIYAYIHT